jgi:hypothetical protein
MKRLLAGFNIGNYFIFQFVGFGSHGLISFALF